MNKRNLFRPRFVNYSHDFYKCDLLISEQSEFDGRIVEVPKYVTDVPSERYKGLKASQFCLETLLAVGADLRSENRFTVNPLSFVDKYTSIRLNHVPNDTKVDK